MAPQRRRKQSRKQQQRKRQLQREHCRLISTKWETMEQIRAQEKVVDEITVTISMMKGVFADSTTQEEIDSKGDELIEAARYLGELQEYYTYMDRFRRVD